MKVENLVWVLFIALVCSGATCGGGVSEADFKELKDRVDMFAPSGDPGASVEALDDLKVRVNSLGGKVNGIKDMAENNKDMAEKTNARIDRIGIRNPFAQAGKSWPKKQFKAVNCEGASGNANIDYWPMNSEHWNPCMQPQSRAGLVKVNFCNVYSEDIGHASRALVAVAELIATTTTGQPTVGCTLIAFDLPMGQALLAPASTPRGGLGQLVWVATENLVDWSPPPPP